MKSNKSYNIVQSDDMNNEIQPESADEDSQANNVVFHPQFEPGNKPLTHVSTINLTKT